MSLMTINTNLETQTAGTYLNQLSGELSHNTKVSYLADIKQFFGIENPSELTAEMVRAVTVSSVNTHAEVLFNQGLANSTINRKLQALSKFYTLLLRRDIRMVDYNPFDTKEGANRFKAKSYSSARELEDTEVQLLVSEAKKDNTLQGLRNKIILFILITTGMRREEIATLEIGQIRRTRGQYIIDFTGKGRKDRFVVLTGAIYALILDYLELRGVSIQEGHLPLFISHASNADITKSITTETIYQMVKSLASNAGLDDFSVSPHTFRHTYITKSLEMGCDINTVGDRVGHADVKTTRRYDHTSRILNDNPAEDLLALYTI